MSMWKKTLGKLYDSKLFWIIVSLLGSICLWVYVTSVETEVTETTLYGLPVQFVGEDALRESKGLIISDVSADTVQVTLQGSIRELSKLDERNVTAYIDVTELEARSYSYPVQLQFPDSVNASDVSIIRRVPDNITFTVENVKQRTIDVMGVFNGTVAEGYVSEPITTNPSTIDIYGAESVINQVAYALVTIDRQDVSSTITYDSTYQLIDTEGNIMETDGITMSTDQVQVTMVVNVTKEVALSVDILDGGGASVENAVVDIEPSSILLSGDAQQLEGINRIVLSTIDLSLVDDTFEETYTIILDNGITNESGVTEATVTVTIRGLEKTEMTIDNINIIGQTEGTTATLMTQSITVTLRGPAAILEQVRPEDVRAEADMTNFNNRSGQVSVPVRIYVDGFESIGAVGEYSVIISVS